jgi:hypothetical protein
MNMEKKDSNRKQNRKGVLEKKKKREKDKQI